MSQHLQEAKHLTDELSIVGRTIALIKFNAINYHNLGAELHNIITTFIVQANPVSFHKLYSQLITHEILLNNSNDAPLVANLANKKNAP